MFDNGVQLPPDAIVQAWKANDMPAVVKAGLKTTNSYKWYLNHACDNYGDGLWGDFYTNDPLKWLNDSTTSTDMGSAQNKMISTALDSTLVIGGETTMWSECVDGCYFSSS